jgi:hypothetical protein
MPLLLCAQAQGRGRAEGQEIDVERTRLYSPKDVACVFLHQHVGLDLTCYRNWHDGSSSQNTAIVHGHDNAQMNTKNLQTHEITSGVRTLH